MAVRYYDWIAHHARRTPTKIALVDLGSERRLSYAALDERIARLARFLREAHGVDRGARVAVLALNTTDTMELQFACGRLGAIFVPLNTRLAVPEAAVIAHCRERLAHFKCPRVVRFVDTLPRNATGKVHKPTLRTEMAALLGR